MFSTDTWRLVTPTCGFVKLVVCALCFIGSSSAYSQTPNVSKPEALFVLHGMANERQQLRSGTCSMDYFEEYKHIRSPGGAEVTEATVHLWFEGNDRFRMDWSYPQSAAKARFAKEPNDIPISSSAKERTGYFIHTKDHNIQWLEGRRYIDILPPESKPPAWISYFDVKALGTNSWHELKTRYTWEERIKEWLKPTFLPMVATLAKDAYAMTWQLGNENSEWVVEVNVARGFTPYHAFMRQRKDSTKPWRTVQEFTTMWQKQGGAWIPVHFEAREEQDPSISTRKLTIDLSWSKVNGDIPEKIFSYESFGAPNAVGVIDSRLGRPVEIKQPGHGVPTDTGPESKWPSRITMLVINVLALTIIISVFVFWRMRKRQT